MDDDRHRRRRHHSRDRSPIVEKHRRRKEEESKWEKVRIKEEPHDDQSPRDRRVRDDRSHREDEPRRRKAPVRNEREDGDKKYEWGKRPIKTESNDDAETKPKEKPNFGLSGNLAKDTNMFNGIVIKYNEPPEARKPKLRWRLYPFKEDEPLDFIPIHRQSAYLLGRDRRVADIPIDHPSCSKQHAVVQYRLVKRSREDGSVSRRVRPYVIDLGASNGTFVNNQRIEAERYYELFEKDVIKFGFSSREYVLLHENSQEEVEATEEIGEDVEVEASTEGGT